MLQSEVDWDHLKKRTRGLQFCVSVACGLEAGVDLVLNRINSCSDWNDHSRQVDEVYH